MKYYSSTATTVAPKRLSVTLQYIVCLFVVCLRFLKAQKFKAAVGGDDNGNDDADDVGGGDGGGKEQG